MWSKFEKHSGSISRLLLRRLDFEQSEVLRRVAGLFVRLACRAPETAKDRVWKCDDDFEMIDERERYARWLHATVVTVADHLQARLHRAGDIDAYDLAGTLVAHLVDSARIAPGVDELDPKWD